VSLEQYRVFNSVDVQFDMLLV